jgi:hypothetical protein
METSTQSASKRSKTLATVIGLFGLYLFAGAFVSLFSGRWPAFMPPVLDALAIPLTLLSQQLGAIAGGIVAGAFGVFFLLFCARLLAKSSKT